MEKGIILFQSYKEFFHSLAEILKDPINAFDSKARDLSSAFFKYHRENKFSKRQKNDLLFEYLRLFEKYINIAKGADSKQISGEIFVLLVSEWIRGSDEYELELVRFKKAIVEGKAANLKNPLYYVYFKAISIKQRAKINASLRLHNKEIRNSLEQFISRTYFYLHEEEVKPGADIDFITLVANHEELRNKNFFLADDIHRSLDAKSFVNLKSAVTKFAQFLNQNTHSLEETVQLFLWARRGLRLRSGTKRFLSDNIYEGSLQIYILCFYFVARRILSDNRSLSLTESDFFMVMEPVSKLRRLKIEINSKIYLAPDLGYYYKDYEGVISRIFSLDSNSKNVTANILNKLSISNLSLLLFADSKKVVWLNSTEHNKTLAEINQSSPKELKQNSVYINSPIALQRGYVGIGSRVGEFRVVYISNFGNPYKEIFVTHKSIKNVIFKFSEKELKDRITNQLVSDLYNLNKQLLVLIPFLFEFLGYIYTGVVHGAVALAKEVVSDVVKDKVDKKTGLPIGLSWDLSKGTLSALKNATDTNLSKFNKGIGKNGVTTETRIFTDDDYSGYRLVDQDLVTEIRYGKNNKSIETIELEDTPIPKTKGQIKKTELEDKGIIGARVLVLSDAQAKLQGEIRGQIFTSIKNKRSKTAKRIFMGLTNHTKAAFKEIDGENLLNDLLAQPKNNKKSRELFDKMRNKLWGRVRSDIKLKTDFESAGIYFDPTGAPYFLLVTPKNGYYKVRLDIDHNVALSIDNKSVINVDNFLLTSAKENQYPLRIVEINSTWEKLRRTPGFVEVNIKSGLRTKNIEEDDVNSEEKKRKTEERGILRSIYSKR